jgi:hypothetical protein
VLLLLLLLLLLLPVAGLVSVPKIDATAVCHRCVLPWRRSVVRGVGSDVFGVRWRLPAPPATTEGPSCATAAVAGVHAPHRHENHQHDDGKDGKKDHPCNVRISIAGASVRTAPLLVARATVIVTAAATGTTTAVTFAFAAVPSTPAVGAGVRW